MFRGFGHPRKGQDDMARRFAKVRWEWLRLA